MEERKNYLNSLIKSAEWILNLPEIPEIKKRLKYELRRTKEKFVWHTIDISTLDENVSDFIKSVWIFVLRHNTPSLSHYHPNSTQYTLILEGKGKVNIGGRNINLQKFDPNNCNTIYEIERNCPHEFFPDKKDLVVISFHTAVAEKLIEINIESGFQRRYT